MFLIKKGATAAGGDREIILPPRRGGFSKVVTIRLYYCAIIFTIFLYPVPAIFIATHSLLLDFFSRYYSKWVR